MKLWLLNLQVSRVLSDSSNNEPEDLDYNDLLYKAEYTNGTDNVVLEHRAGVCTAGESANDTKIYSNQQINYSFVSAALTAFHNLLVTMQGCAARVEYY
jgi:hypothetical protein